MTLGDVVALVNNLELEESERELLLWYLFKIDRMGSEFMEFYTIRKTELGCLMNKVTIRSHHNLYASELRLLNQLKTIVENSEAL